MGLVTDYRWTCPGCGSKEQAQLYDIIGDGDALRYPEPIRSGSTFKWNPPCEKCGKFEIDIPRDPVTPVIYPVGEEIMPSAFVEPQHPIQPLQNDHEGVLRFKDNPIVRHLLKFGQERGCGLNELGSMNFSDEDHQQFAQLIGYSLSGYAELDFVSDEAYEAAAAKSPKET